MDGWHAQPIQLPIGLCGLRQGFTPNLKSFKCSNRHVSKKLFHIVVQNLFQTLLEEVVRENAGKGIASISYKFHPGLHDRIRRSRLVSQSHIHFYFLATVLA